MSFPLKPSKRFNYINNFITLDNIIGLLNYGLNTINSSKVDVISIDTDGNDIYFLNEILKNHFLPKLFIVEYNAQFIRPSKFKIKYYPNFKWKRDKYFGAALQNFIELFSNYEYSLICYNIQSGSNAFFIKNEYLNFFYDIPTDINKIYVSPQYFPIRKFGHRQSPNVVSSILFD